jgi:toxin CptA
MNNLTLPAGVHLPAGAAVWIAMVCVALMGFAIQRGGTCMVAAVYELLTLRRRHRLVAIFEASLWVAGVLMLAQCAGLTRGVATGYAVSGWTVAGGVLFGLGAWLNRSCALGTVAQLGSGNWAYALTPLGYFAGCLSGGWLFPRSEPAVAAASLLPPTAAYGLALLFLVYLALRLGRPLLAALRQSHAGRTLWRQVWSPHGATVVIGASFVALLLLTGRWAYTEALADLARGNSVRLGLPVLLLLTLFAGAVVGGYTAGHWRPTVPSTAQAAQCFAGGAVMAWGSLMIPGGNDSLVLIGAPQLQPHAWLALVSMVLSIAAANRELR